MAMHYRQPFDTSQQHLDPANALRSVFRRAVGYALVSAIGVSGCNATADQPELSAGTGQAPNPTTQGGLGPAAMPAAMSDSPTLPTMAIVSAPPVATLPSAGAAAPTPSAGAAGAAITSRATPAKVTCLEGFPYPQLFQGLTPAQPFDAAEYRVQAMSLSEPQIWLRQGVLCETASNLTACQAEVDRLADEPNLLWSKTRPMFGKVAEYILTTRADEVRKYQTRDELLQFLGPIDSPQDVLLLLYYDDRGVACSEPQPNTSFAAVVPSSIRERNDGYEILFLNQQYRCDGNSIERVTLFVARDGKVTEIAREMMTEMKGCEGRRPEGLCSAHIADGTSALGEHFARMAHLEHASVAAFDVLALELAAHHAPEELVTWARRSASDELRHTATTRELAQRFGAKPTAAEVAERPLRSLEAIAIENAREGCVRECYGAALGWYQARSSTDADIAAAMAQIAEDETNHAALAFAVDAWACSRLDDRGRARVASARAEAVRDLRCELQLAPDASTRTALGLPDSSAALRLCSVLEQSLWS